MIWEKFCRFISKLKKFVIEIRRSLLFILITVILYLIFKFLILPFASKFIIIISGFAIIGTIYIFFGITIYGLLSGLVQNLPKTNRAKFIEFRNFYVAILLIPLLQSTANIIANYPNHSVALKEFVTYLLLAIITLYVIKFYWFTKQNKSKRIKRTL